MNHLMLKLKPLQIAFGQEMHVDVTTVPKLFPVIVIAQPLAIWLFCLPDIVSGTKQYLIVVRGINQIT